MDTRRKKSLKPLVIIIIAHDSRPRSIALELITIVFEYRDTESESEKPSNYGLPQV